MVWRNAGGICERKTLFRMKKEADQAGFKGTRTGPKGEKHLRCIWSPEKDGFIFS